MFIWTELGEWIELVKGGPDGGGGFFDSSAQGLEMEFQLKKLSMKHL